MVPLGLSLKGLVGNCDTFRLAFGLVLERISGDFDTFVLVLEGVSRGFWYL